MRVAIDGSFLSLPPSGTATYVRGLIGGLQTIDPSLDIKLVEPSWADAESTDTSIRSKLFHLAADRRVRRARWELFDVGSATRKVRPDLLHIPHFSAPIAPRLPLIVTIHDVIPLVLPEYRASRFMRLHLQAIRRTVATAKLVLTPSNSAAADIERVLGIASKRIRVTPEAADSRYRPADDKGPARQICANLGVSGRYVFNVGGLDVRKNLPVLIEAFARVRQRINEPLQLVIAGASHTDNPTVFPPLEPIIRKFGVDDAVVLPGRISEEQKLALYQCAAVYATPSLYEGFGLTALEAMACGIPVVAANRTSLPEVVGEGGLLVEPDAEAFAEAMTRLLADPSYASGVGQNGLTRSKEFSWELTARLTLDAYHEVIHGLKP